MYNLSVRNIDDGVIVKLKQIARQKNMSLESLARDVLTQYAYAPELKEAEDRFLTFSEEIIRIYQSQTKEVTDRLAENTYVLNKLLEIIERG